MLFRSGPVRVFARALMDDDPIYDADDAPVPPTYPFVMHHWGTIASEGEPTPGLPIDRLRGPGRTILHGEQGFTYTRWPRVGDVLVACHDDHTVVSSVGWSYEAGLVGFHGSLTPAEMLIPVLVD